MNEEQVEFLRQFAAAYRETNQLADDDVVRVADATTGYPGVPLDEYIDQRS